METKIIKRSLVREEILSDKPPKQFLVTVTCGENLYGEFCDRLADFFGDLYADCEVTSFRIEAVEVA